MPLRGGHSPGLVLPGSRNGLEGRGFGGRICCFPPAVNALVEICCGSCGAHLHAGRSGRLTGLLGACPSLLVVTFALVLPFPFLLCPLVIDHPASCVCLHCPGVQLDRAPLWQVPQPGTSALDVQRTVHVCQVRVCFPCPRREESLRRWRVLTLLRAKGRWTQESHSGMDFISYSKAATQTHIVCKEQQEIEPPIIDPSSVPTLELLSFYPAVICVLRK